MAEVKRRRCFKKFKSTVIGKASWLSTAEHFIAPHKKKLIFEIVLLTRKDFRVIEIVSVHGPCAALCSRSAQLGKKRAKHKK